jgi:hypothetical protein
MSHTSVNETTKVLEPLRLPDSMQLDEARRVAASMRGASAGERAAALAERGLLGDLAEFFTSQEQGHAIRGKSVADLAEVIETFETLAEFVASEQTGDTGILPAPDDVAKGNNPGNNKDAGKMPAAHAGKMPVPHFPELRLRECRVDRADLSSLEVPFPLHLEHCVLTTQVCLLGTTFHKQARFVGSEFLREANFFAATFAAGADFSGAHFHGPADFRGATIGQEISFFRANFDQCLELKFAHFEPAAVLNLTEVKFHGSNVLGGSLSMGRAQFRPGLIAGENSRDLHSLAAACEQYGELEANFAAQGSPDSNQARDLCHYRYMDLRRRTTFSHKNPRRLLDWVFLKWCFGYGVYTRRVLFSGAAVILLFALLYVGNGLWMSDQNWAIHYGPDNQRLFVAPEHLANSMCNALYFSTITFATVGYGDWYPQHWARLAAALEGLSGIFIMSVFTVSFARKIIR